MTKERWQSVFRPRWALAAVLSVVCVLGLTHIPGEEMPHVLQGGGLDKVAHIMAYGVMAGLFVLSFRPPVRPVLLLLVLAALALLGALDETTQPLVHRSCDLSDYLSDLAGMGGAVGVLLGAQRGKSEIRNPTLRTRPDPSETSPKPQ